MKIIKQTLFLGTVVVATSLLSGKAKDPGTSLDGYRFEFPCKGAMPENPKKGAGCQSALVKGDPFKTDNFNKVINFGGDAGKTYKATLRFRGVVEPMMYKNGKMDGLAAAWYSNGQKSSERTTKDDKLVTIVVWKRNGEKCSVTNFANGNGVVVSYKDDGTENYRNTYKDGENVYIKFPD